MSDIKQPTESQEEQDSQSQTVHEKLDTLAEIVVANHQMLTALVNAVNSALQQDQPPTPSREAPAIPYQPGYPPPVNEYQNVYGDGREYSSTDEQYRGPRTYNDLPQQGTPDVNPPPHHSPPPPPGGMPPVHPIQPAPQQQGTSGETVMTPAEYRAAHGE
tara:strand:- start:1044 stop:1523 length:480 start_codon:yes stop_codon:yes gene_type:complete